MSHRRLYLAAYDIRADDRLREALYVLKGFASGGQKSVFECFLSRGERRALLAQVRAVLNLNEDRFMLLPLADPAGMRTLGIAVKPSDPEFYYVG